MRLVISENFLTDSVVCSVLFFTPSITDVSIPAENSSFTLLTPFSKSLTVSLTYFVLSLISSNPDVSKTLNDFLSLLTGSSKPEKFLSNHSLNFSSSFIEADRPPSSTSYSTLIISSLITFANTSPPLFFLP